MFYNGEYEVNKMAKKKNGWQKWIAFVLMMGVGAACGIAIAMLLDMLMEGTEKGEMLLMYAVLVVGMYIAMGLQIVVHEAGHLVFGLLTGYRFSSFRVGSMMWLKENGRIVRKKFSLAGTGGQCLMSPPELDEKGMMPVVLYNLGGSVMNLIFSAVCVGLYFLCRPIPMLAVFWVVMALVGVGFALVNGIPLHMGAVDNDGSNALSLRKDRQAVRAFALQMKMNDMMTRGVRPKDMPEEWFEMPSDEGMKNNLIAAIAVMACSRQIDMHKFEQADAEIARILDMDSAILGIHRVQMVCERIYCELIGPCRRDVIEGMLSKEQKKMMKAMKTMPSVIRLEYALALLLEKDMEKAEKALAQFEKIAKKYPYPADLESERELIDIARQRANADNGAV